MSSSPARRRQFAASLCATALLGAVAQAQCHWIPGQGFDLAQSTVVDSRVHDLLSLTAGEVIAAGAFDRIGSAVANNIARWDGSTWLALGAGTNGPVHAVALAPNGDLVVAGAFTAAGGTPATGVARWNGVSWAALGAGIAGTVTEVAVLTNGDVVAAAGGTVSRWNGATWSVLGTISGPPSPGVHALAAAPGGDVIVAGNFLFVNGVTARLVARWASATNSWQPIGAGTELSPSASIPNAFTVAVTAGGGIEVGGDNLGLSSHTRASWNGVNWSFSLPSFMPGLGVVSIVDLDLVANGDILMHGLTSPFGRPFVALTSGGTTTVLGTGTSFPYTGWPPRAAVCGFAGGPYYVGGSLATFGGGSNVGMARNACGVGFAVNYGFGCYRQIATLYEHFPGALFDLSQSAVRLDFNGHGYVATHVPGTPVFTAPAGTALTLGDDSLAPPTSLPFTIPYPGGATSQIQIGSNGFVYLQPGSDASPYYGNVPGLLNGTPRWAPLWADHDPGPSGGGTVSVAVDAVAQTVTVTWLNVQEYAQPLNLSSFQLVANAAGDVEYRYLACSMGLAALTGWSPGSGASDRGSVDLSSGQPFVCFPDQGPLQHDASAWPFLGTTISLATTSVPPNSILGATILGTTRFDPGIDLTSIGMEGCSLYASLDVVATAVPSLPSFAYTLTIPNLTSLIGAQFHTQGIALAVGFNPFGFVSSNGVTLVLGNP